MTPVGPVDVASDLAKRLSLVEHAHHVPRDADADPSAKAHPIELEPLRARGILEVAGRVARVSFGAATAEARDVPERVPVGDSEAVRLTDLGAHSLERIGNMNGIRRRSPLPRLPQLDVTCHPRPPKLIEPT